MTNIQKAQNEECWTLSPNLTNTHSAEHELWSEGVGDIDDSPGIGREFLKKTNFPPKKNHLRRDGQIEKGREDVGADQEADTLAAFGPVTYGPVTCLIRQNTEGRRRGRWIRTTQYTNWTLTHRVSSIETPDLILTVCIIQTQYSHTQSAVSSSGSPVGKPKKSPKCQTTSVPRLSQELLKFQHLKSTLERSRNPEGVGERQKIRQVMLGMTLHHNRTYPRYEPQVSYWKSTDTQQRYTTTHMENKKGNCPPRKTNSSCTGHPQDHQWEMVSEEYLWIEVVFLAESQYSWWCGHVPSLGTIDTSSEYV